MNLTLGSLFDGSGGFPLGGMLAGIEPVWASEIEPFAIRVTEKRLPQVQHYGDVSKIDGAAMPPVDIITFGSPCQDLSVAGKRAGLNGSRSGLFFQAIRIIREMREATNGKYPRFAVYENVPGAFSSNNGEDFRIVLEQLCQIKDACISVPRPAERWTKSGEIVGEHFSLAWRVLDAQYFGVAQRRKRIFLVCDFDEECAGKILFDESRLHGHFAESLRERKRAAGCAEESIGTTGAVTCLNDMGGAFMNVSDNVSGTLRAESHGHAPAVMQSAGFCTEHSAKARGIGFEEETAPTLRAGVVPAALLFENHSQDTRYTGPLETAPTVSATYGMGGNNQPFVVEVPKVYGICSKKSNSMLSDNPHSGFYEAETTRTLDTSGSDPSCAQGGMVVVEGNGSRPSHHGNGYSESATMYTINTVEVPAVAYGIERAAFNMGKNAKFSMAIDEDVQPTMVAKGAGAVAQPVVYSTNKSTFHTAAETDVAGTLVATDYKDPPTVAEEPYYIVRRLLPQECARLQGFPSWWCDDLGTEHPTDEEIDRWLDIFETFRCATGATSKPRTRNMVAKWLRKPYSDSATYRLWGNGVCLNAVFYVLSGIAANCEQTDTK